jgi:hypothetical protein
MNVLFASRVFSLKPLFPTTYHGYFTGKRVFNFPPPTTKPQIKPLLQKQPENKPRIKVRGVGFEPTNPYRTGS